MLIAIYDGASLHPNGNLGYWALGHQSASNMDNLLNKTPAKFPKLCGLEYQYKQKVI